MEYYCLKVDKRYTDAPVVKNWYGKLKRENICLEKAHLLPKRELLEITYNSKVVFTDIITFPYFLVSDMCKKVISKYEPNTIYRQIVLMDIKSQKFQVYHLPILPQIAPIKQKRDYLGLGVKEELPVLSEKDIGFLKVFQVIELEKTYTIARLDVLESLLRRRAKGIDIEEVKVVR